VRDPEKYGDIADDLPPSPFTLHASNSSNNSSNRLRRRQHWQHLQNSQRPPTKRHEKIEEEIYTRPYRSRRADYEGALCQYKVVVIKYEFVDGREEKADREREMEMGTPQASCNIPSIEKAQSISIRSVSLLQKGTPF